MTSPHPLKWLLVAHGPGLRPCTSAPLSPLPSLAAASARHLGNIQIDQLRGKVVQLDPKTFDSEEAVAALAQCIPSADDAAALEAYQRSGGWVGGGAAGDVGWACMWGCARL